jgi:hypothetical protein
MIMEYVTIAVPSKIKLSLFGIEMREVINNWSS